MEYNQLFDKFWIGGVNYFGNPDNMMKEMELEEIETEEFEIVRGDFKSTITCRFNKKGYLISTSGSSEDVSEKKILYKRLREALDKALTEQNLEEVKHIQDQLNKLRFLDERVKKPTFY